MKYSKLTKGGKARRKRAIKEILFNILIVVGFIVIMGIAGTGEYESLIR